MSKPSGWNRWKDTGGGARPGRDTGTPGTTHDSLQRFAESSKGPVARALWDQELIDYDDNGKIAVNRNQVQAEAREFVKDTQDASYPKDYIIKSYKDTTPGAENISDQAAEGRINRYYAGKAQAVLTAAEVGNVKLTEAQRERLQGVADGRYLEMKYSQYKSGDRGTLLKEKKERRAGLDSTTEAAAERRRVFYTEVMRSRRRVA